MVALTAIGSLMAALDTLVVSTSLSTIRLDLGASIEDLEWTVNAYNLSFAVLITAAALGDRYGRRAFYAIGLGLFAAASAAAALAPSVGFLVAARAAQGAGAALVLTLGLTLLTAAFPPEKRGAAIGLFSAVTGIAVALGPLVGGAIAEGIDWTWIFWLNVPIGLAAIPLVLRKIEESYGGDTGLDIPGLALISAGPSGWSGAWCAGTPSVGTASRSSALAAGAVLVAAFIAWELRAAEPMVPMRFFRSRAFSAGNAAIFFTLASLFGAVFFFAQMLQTALGYGPLDAGLRLMPWTVTFITVAPVVGNLVDRVGERPFMVAGLSLQAVAMGWIAVIADSGLTYSEFLLPSILAGVGVSMAIPAAQNSVVGSFSVEDIGKAAGVNSMMRELGGVLGLRWPPRCSPAPAATPRPTRSSTGSRPRVAVLAGFSALGAIVALALPGRRPTAESLRRSGPGVRGRRRKLITL